MTPSGPRLEDALESPLKRMTRQDVITACSVALVGFLGVVVWALVFLPWLLRWRGEGYLLALSALSTAASALFTLVAGLAAAAYVALTHRLVQQTAAHRESDLMLRIVDEYDELRADIEFLREYYDECTTQTGQDPADRFRVEMRRPAAVPDDLGARSVDDPRFVVSRFFVRIRKLVKAGYLTERVVIAALDREAIEMFLQLIDPLDEATAGTSYKADDREFFTSLLRLYEVR